MSRLPQLKEYAKQWGMKLISIADLISYRFQTERFVFRKSDAVLPSIFGILKLMDISMNLMVLSILH